MTVAALYVQPCGCYTDLDGVDPWPEWRDAMLYGGPWPVVAHPPCQRWCQLASVNEARYGQAVGDDGGTFEQALTAVRRWGGVLEHPAFSLAWDAYELAHPPTAGGWVAADFEGGWTCHVEQGHFGHRARKATWLYACHVTLPSLTWGRSEGRAWVSWGDFDRYPDVPRLGKAEALASPPAFRDMLIETARTARDKVEG